MSNYHILYNPLAANGRGEENVKVMEKFYPNEMKQYTNITTLENMDEFFKKVPHDDKIVICGGDGTLNFVANNVECDKIKTEVLYYPMGSGNDFANDMGKTKEDAPFRVNEALINLPICRVKGREYKFINGIGYGIDGYCCEVGDKQRAKSDKPINYASIAIKGLLFFFHPSNAVVEVDGKEYKYWRVYLAPTMKGRYYGGGMMCAPDQARFDVNREVTFVCAHLCSRLKLLMIFPSIFKGEHVKHKMFVKTMKGKHVKVKFSKPQALQVDGETITAVSEYEVIVK